MTDIFILVLAVTQIAIVLMVYVLIRKVQQLESNDYIQDNAIDMLFWEMEESFNDGDFCSECKEDKPLTKKK